MKSIRTAGLVGLLLTAPVMVSMQGCTDLGETPFSSISPENFFRTEAEVIGGMAAVYAGLRSSLWGYYNLSQVSSDEHIVPTRGSDWYDNGRWLEIHRQTWGANTPAGLSDINGAFNDAFIAIARANVVLSALQNVNVANQAVVEAELRTLRAFYYYMLMDLFGGVPIVTTTEIMPRERNTRAEVFAFIESELNDTRAVLPAQWPAAMYGRLTRGAADAILANMYLNAQVFTGEVTVTGLQPGPARWQDAINAADRVLDAGVYSLAPEWRSNFRHDNDLSPENIFVVRHLAQDGLGFQMIYRALHYHQATPGPWNGFATLAETYYAFDRDDARDSIFLVGRQRNVETGELVDDRAGQPLFFTPEIGDATQAAENEGVRIYKWPADPNRVGSHHGNDYAYFRLAEMLLIKAEALNELGQTAPALVIVNQLRERVFNPDKPLIGPFTQGSFREAILRERLFELTAEAKRRQDLIRHGRFTAPWSFKPQREPYRILMPIPQSQRDANPKLTQNPGY